MTNKFQAAWEEESRRNTRGDSSQLSPFGFKNKVSPEIQNLLEQQKHQLNNLIDQTLGLEEKGMPRSKRKASSNVQQSAAEDMSRHSSKRFKTNRFGFFFLIS